jgi:hypothetical protein
LSEPRTFKVDQDKPLRKWTGSPFGRDEIPFQFSLGYDRDSHRQSSVAVRRPNACSAAGGGEMAGTSIPEYITGTFAGVDVVEAMGASFFFFDPEHMFPFATIVTNDEHDQASNLNRPSVFRLNIGVSKQTFQSLFGPGPVPSADEGAEGPYDFTALDRIMPHPVYGKMYWTCVLNPSAATFETVQTLLDEAYQMAVRKRAKANPADS